MDDWTPWHQRAAVAEGWRLREVDQALPSSAIEIQSASCTDPDEGAVDTFRRSWITSQDHAVLAFQILRYQSPAEFQLWGLNEWPNLSQRSSIK